MKISEFFIWNFSVLDVNFSIYLNKSVFVMLKTEAVASTSSLKIAIYTGLTSHIPN